MMMDLIRAHFQIQISTEALKNQIVKTWKIKLGMFLLLVGLSICIFSCECRGCVETNVLCFSHHLGGSLIVSMITVTCKSYNKSCFFPSLFYLLLNPLCLSIRRVYLMQTEAEFYFNSLSKDSIESVVKNSLWILKNGSYTYTFFNIKLNNKYIK